MPEAFKPISILKPSIMKSQINKNQTPFCTLCKRFSLIILMILIINNSFAQCPDIIQPSNQVVCNGNSTAAVNFSGSVPGTVFTWTNNNPSIGLAAGGIGNIPSFTPVNSTYATVTATITVTPSVTGSDFAYITNQNSNSVSAININTNTVAATIPVGNIPWGVSVSPDGTRAYITNFNSGTVSVINTSNNTVIATIGVGVGPIGVVVSSDGLKAYVTNLAANTVSVINTSTNAVTATIVVGDQPLGIALNLDGSKLFVSNNNSNLVSVINTATNSVTSTISVGSNPYGLCFYGGTNKLYVANTGSNTVSVVNTVTNSLDTTINVGISPRCISICADGSRAFVTNSGGDNLSVINTSTSAVIATISVGIFPFGVSVNPDCSRAYVANIGTNDVTVINTASNAVISTIAAGDGPTGFGNFISSHTGCTGTPKSFTITVMDKISPYIIYAKTEARFGEYNSIGGDVGVTDANGIASFKNGDVLNPYRVYAKNISVEIPSQINNRTYASASGGPNPPFLVYNGTGGTGSYIAATSGTVNGNYKSLTIKRGITCTVTGNDFGTIIIGEGASVTFTSPLINMEELNLKAGDGEESYTWVNFSRPTELKVSKKVKVSEWCRVNENGPRVIFYMGDNNPDEERFIINGEDTRVTANIMIPHGLLKVNGSEDNNIVMTGWYIIEKLKSQGRNITWNKYTCSLPSAPVGNMPVTNAGNNPVKDSPVTSVVQPLKTGTELNIGFKVNIYPNPSRGDIHIQVLSGSNDQINARIFNDNGKMIQFVTKLNKTGFVKWGSANGKGIYLMEVTQGMNKQVIKLIRID